MMFAKIYYERAIFSSLNSLLSFFLAVFVSISLSLFTFVFHSLSICLYFYISYCLSIRSLSEYLSSCFSSSICLPLFLSVSLFHNICLYLSVGLSVVCHSVSISVRLSIYLSHIPNTALQATHSSGNHGQALSWASKVAGFPCYVVVPETAPEVKKRAIKAYGGQLVECGPNLQDR